MRAFFAPAKSTNTPWDNLLKLDSYCGLVPWRTDNAVRGPHLRFVVAAVADEPARHPRSAALLRAAVRRRRAARVSRLVSRTVRAASPIGACSKPGCISDTGPNSCPISVDERRRACKNDYGSVLNYFKALVGSQTFADVQVIPLSRRKQGFKLPLGAPTKSRAHNAVASSFEFGAAQLLPDERSRTSPNFAALTRVAWSSQRRLGPGKAAR